MKTREIKFRAWDGRRMTTSGIMFNTSTGCVEVPTQASFGGEMTTKFHVMQFTGLFDKNGKEIYESDIVKILNDKIQQKAVVKWHEQSCSFMLMWWDNEGKHRVKSLEATSGGDYYQNDYLEIVGNQQEQK